MEQWELSNAELAGLCSCPVDALRFSRVVPVHLAHGAVPGPAWRRWIRCAGPSLVAPVNHGGVVAVRPVLGSCSADYPGQDFGVAGSRLTGSGTLGGLEGLMVFRRHALPLEPASCPVDQELERALGWPLAGEFLRAQQAGDGSALLRNRL